MKNDGMRAKMARFNVDQTDAAGPDAPPSAWKPEAAVSTAPTEVTALQPDVIGRSGTKRGKTGVPAILVLEDGSVFMGTSCGATGEVAGEVCVNTVMIGYPEVISDPANAGQILAITYPQVGNYGIALADLECERATLRALVVRDVCDTPSNYRLDCSLPEFLVDQGIVGITDVDTRALTQLLRDNGPLRAIVSTNDLDPESLLIKVRVTPTISEEDLVAEVSCEQPYLFTMNEEHIAWYPPLPDPRFKVIVIDLGVTRSTLNNLTRLGCAVIVVPWDTPVAEILAYQPDGVVLSSGPGDPQALAPVIQTTAGLLGILPLLAIGLGHQVLALAVGGEVQRLAFGHHGANYPVSDLAFDKVKITAQSHAFSVLPDSLGALESRDLGMAIAMNANCGRIRIAEANLNDGTVEGLLYLDVPAVSVEYLPEFPASNAIGSNAFNSFMGFMEENTTGLGMDSEDSNA